jgi:predicted nucleotidyltransferase
MPVRRDEVAALLRAHRAELERLGVRSLRLFGSVARNEAGPDSDFDILVDLGGPAGFAQYMDLLFFLEELLGTTVDLVTVRGLREEVRPEVEREAIRVA